MQINGNDDGESPQRRANPTPPVANRVHGLGDSHALRVDFEPVQLPWFANEIDTLRLVIEEALAQARAARDGHTPAVVGADSERRGGVARREYQLRVLAMIREQVPVSAPLARACVASPWDEESHEHAREVAGVTAPVTVVGPARGMLVLIRGAARNATDALGEALRLSERDLVERQVGTAATRWPELHRLTAAVASRLGDVAAAAHAFVQDYIDAVRQQGYSFDPDHYPVGSDELW